jgi:hypothetical protein
VNFAARTLGVAGAGAALILATTGATSEAAKPNQLVSSPAPCRAGTPAPISEAVFKRALALRGFTLHREHDLCVPDPRLLVTLSDAGAYLNCFIYRRNVFGSRLQRFVWRNDPRPTYLRVLNVECGFYAESRSSTDNVERGFRRLPGVSSQSTTLPSPAAIHD